MGREGRHYKTLLVLGLVLAVLAVAAIVALSPFLGIDWVPFASAVVSLFLAFLMLIAVYVAVDQLRISVESSENVVSKLAEVAERTEMTNRGLEEVGQSLLAAYDLQAEEAGRKPELDVFFADGSKELRMTQGRKQIRFAVGNGGTTTCRNPTYDMIFPRGIQTLEDNDYTTRVVQRGVYQGQYAARFSHKSAPVGYDLEIAINVIVPPEVFGRKTVKCISWGDNCGRFDTELVLDISA